MSRLPADRTQTALLRALAPVVGAFALIAIRSVPWSSATFDGARHRLALRLEGEDAAARAEVLCVTLAETELTLRGAFVADIVVTARLEDGAPVLGIEALTIEDADAPAILSRDARRAG
jgi:hypothetical protein